MQICFPLFPFFSLLSGIVETQDNRPAPGSKRKLGHLQLPDRTSVQCYYLQTYIYIVQRDTQCGFTE